MKRINTLLLALLSVVALTWTSCNDSIEYTPVGPVEGAGVYFPTSTRTSYELEGTQGEITLSVMRTDSVGAFDATLSTTFSEGGESVFTVPASVSFADGASTSSMTISYDNLVQGTTYTVSMTFDEGTPYSNSSLTLTFLYPEEVVYEWEVVSEQGIYTDNIFSMFGISNIVITDIVVEKAVGYDMYRFQSPYNNDYMEKYVIGTPDFFPDDFEYPYIVLDGETYEGKWYIAPTKLGFQLLSTGSIGVDSTWETFGSVAGNLSTSAGPIEPDNADYPLGTYDERKQTFDFGSVFHQLGDIGYYPIEASFTLSLDPALLEADYDRDYTWHEVPEATGMFSSTLAESVWQQTIEQSEEDPTFYRMPNLYVDAEKAHVYFNVDLETGTVTIPRGQDTGLTSFGNIVRLEGTPNRSSYDTETGELTLAFTLYLSNEEGDNLADLIQVTESFLWGQTLSAPIDDYVGQWIVPFSDGTEDMQILVNISKQNANTLAVQGLSGMDAATYDDTMYIVYDEQSGNVYLPFQQVNPVLVDPETQTYYYGFLAAINTTTNMLGSVNMVGGITQTGSLRFLDPSYDATAYLVSPDGNSFSFMTGYWNDLEWYPYSTSAVDTKSVTTFGNLNVTDNFKFSFKKEKVMKNIQGNELNIKPQPVQRGLRTPMKAASVPDNSFHPTR